MIQLIVKNARYGRFLLIEDLLSPLFNTSKARWPVDDMIADKGNRLCAITLKIVSIETAGTCRSELVREESSTKLIANKFAPTGGGVY
ncbi:MAG: hypothetical protein ABW185_19475 [Sedimenticola sp.]